MYKTGLNMKSRLEDREEEVTKKVIYVFQMRLRCFMMTFFASSLVMAVVTWKKSSHCGNTVKEHLDIFYCILSVQYFLNVKCGLVVQWHSINHILLWCFGSVPVVCHTV